jgi:hypothetical protein
MLLLPSISSLLTSKVKTSSADVCFINLLAEGLSTPFNLREGYALPDSQAGNFRSLELGTFFTSHNQQGNSPNQRQTAENRRNGNVLLLFRRGVDGPEVKNLFLMGVVKSLIGEGQPAQNN